MQSFKTAAYILGRTWIGMSGIYYLIRYNTIIQQLALVPESSGLISFFSLYPFGSIQPSGLGRSTMLGLVLVLVDEFRSLSTSRLFNTFMPHFSTNELPLRGVHFDQYPSPLRLFSKVDECYRYLKRRLVSPIEHLALNSQCMRCFYKSGVSQDLE